jgi:hypothetical protein
MMLRNQPVMSSRKIQVESMTNYYKQLSYKQLSVSMSDSRIITVTKKLTAPIVFEVISH